MKILSTSEAKENFGHLLDMTHDGPAAIESNRRTVAVMVSLEDYESSDICDDEYWIARAEANQGEGYVGPEESEAFIRSILNASD